MIVIGGPTAVGKTALALELVSMAPDRFEIISADSVQVYRKLDIGSAKPSPPERARAMFHMVDIADPDEDFTLAQYQSAAEAAIVGIRSRGHLPLVVGGTGLYIRSITSRLDIPAAPPDQELRDRWLGMAAEMGRHVLHEALHAVDPISAARIHANDSKRIIRAIEVYEKTGRPISEWRRINEQTAQQDNPAQLIIGMDMERSALYSRIEHRVESMMREGLVDEVRQLREDGYSAGLKPMQAVGYRQINHYLDGCGTLDDAVAEIKTASRQYARRQLIWFRAFPGIVWIMMDQMSVAKAAAQILRLLER